MSPIDTLVTHAQIDAGEVRLHAVWAGTGPTAVLLHGFPQHWRCWRHQIAGLSEAGYRVVAPDLRGYGGSDKPHPVRAYRRRHLVADVIGLLDHLGEERVHLVGHDWGAMVAWYVAMAHPERLRTLSILNVPHPLRYLASLADPAQRRKSWYVFYFQLPGLAERMILEDDCAYVRRMLREDRRSAQTMTDEDIERTVRAVQAPGAARGMVNYYRAALRHDLVRAPWTIRRIDTPTRVLWGDRDRFLVPSAAEPPADRVPHAEVIHLPEASHWLPEDAPERVNALLAEHFRAG